MRSKKKSLVQEVRQERDIRNLKDDILREKWM